MENQFKKQIIFVQGTDTKKPLWDSLITLMAEDQPIQRRYSWHIYPTDREMEDLNAATQQFAQWYKALKTQWQNSDIILVGHGLGGILILNFIIKHLENGNSRELYNLRQLILFATPHMGYSEIAAKTLILSFFKYKSTIQTLKTWNAQILEVNEQLREHVIEATEFNNFYRPISIQTFGGEQDSCVNAASAQGYHTNFTTLTGDYLSLTQPINREDIRYQSFKACLYNPPAHKGIYSIEYLNIFIRVEPFPAGSLEVTHGNQSRLVVTDNFGIITRKVKFADDNICLQPYILRYGIENEEGYLEALPSGGINIASADKIEQYEARGLEYFFEVIPENEKEFILEVHLYKGFDPQFRDIHFHLGNGRSQYKKINITLDLQRYRQQQYQVEPLPVLMLHPEDSHSCELRFSERHESHSVPIMVSSDGIWQWVIDDIGGGVLDLFWGLNTEKSN